MSFLVNPHSFGVSPLHRYWRITITDTNVASTGVTAIHELWIAESRGAGDATSTATVTTNSEQSGFEIAKAFDRNFSTLWASAAGSFPRTITIDYGATAANWKSLNEIRMVVDAAWDDYAPEDFTFAWSDDNSSYTTVITVTNENSWPTSFTSGAYHSKNWRTAGCPDTESGYLFGRLLISAGVDATQCAIGELEFRDTVSGTDRSVATMAMWSHQAGGNPAINAFDNNASSGGWFGTNGFPYYIGCQFYQRYAIAEVSIVPYPAFQAYAPKDFKVQGSNDGSTWVDLMTVTNQTGWSAAPTARLFT